MLSKTQLRLGTVANVPIYMHLGCLVLLPLGMMVMALEPLPEHADWSPIRRWLRAAATAVLMALSIFLHDVGHLIVARTSKLPVRKLTLFPFGGVYRLGSVPIPSTKLVQMALAGPLVSLMLAAFWWSAWTVWPEAHLLWLAQFSLLLVVINLMPTPPLDGGLLLWLLPGSATSLQGGTPIAFLAMTMLLMGLALPGGTAVLIGLLLASSSLVVGGILLLLTGWLIIRAPVQTVHLCTREQQQWLHKTTVGEMITRSPVMVHPNRMQKPTVLGQTTLMTAVAPSLPNVLPKHLPFRTLEPWTVYPSTSLMQALQKLDTSRGSRLLVIEDGRITHTVTRDQLLAPFKQAENLLQLKAESLILLQPNHPVTSLSWVTCHLGKWLPLNATKRKS